MAGDFNFHIDDQNDRIGTRFRRLINTLSLKQHVRGSTHVAGHTLDFFMTRVPDSVTTRQYIISTGFSDHYAVHLRLPLQKPPLQRKEISYRKLRSIDICAFKADFLESPFVTSVQQLASPDDVLTNYNSSVTAVLDKYAPLKTRTITLRPSSPWFTDDLQKEKQLKCSLERKVSSGLPSDRARFREQCNRYYSLIGHAKENYCKEQISAAGNDQKKLFGFIDTLLNGKTETALPLHSSKEELVERFSDFFIKKIKKIWSDLLIKQESLTCVNPDPAVFSGTPFSVFSPVTEQDLAKIIKNSATKLCRPHYNHVGREFTSRPGWSLFLHD